jgi:hypothetical protein
VGVLLLIVTLFFELPIVFSIFAITVLSVWAVVLHPDAIGVSHGYFSGTLSILLRYCAAGFFITVFMLYYPLHGITIEDIIYLGLLITWFIGYFMSFMKRKNFSAWITLLFPAILLTSAVFFSNIIFKLFLFSLYILDKFLIIQKILLFLYEFILISRGKLL